MSTIETPKAIISEGLFLEPSDAVWEQVKEYAPTFLTEFAVMFSQIVTYKLAAHFLGKQGFSEYSLARRTVSLIFPIPVLGLVVGLPRYIGLCKGRDDDRAASRYFGATLWCVGGAGIACLLLINLFAGGFGYLFFGDRNYRAFALPISLMMLGLCLHAVVCGYFRGRMRLNLANALQLVNLVIAPVCVFLLFRNSLSRVLTIMGLVWTGVAGVGLLFTPFQGIRETAGKRYTNSCVTVFSASLETLF